MMPCRLVNSGEALRWVEILLSFSTLVQSLEWIHLRKVMTPQGVWHWESLKPDLQSFPRILMPFFERIFPYPNFIGVLLLRVLAALVLLFHSHPTLVLILLFTTILGNLRWRGTFNGGSDFMTLSVLLPVSIASLAGNSTPLQTGCLWYVSIQACTSYLIAGWIKIKKKNWRTGAALTGFVKSAIYSPRSGLTELITIPAIALLTSWAVMIFELTFPLALLNPSGCLAFLTFGLVFHLGNAYFFGLNRFLLAWAAAYPALYFCSGK
jgi:hypothetical protein